jgi:hypothetical protein
MKKSILALMVAGLVFNTSCENADKEFPDYDTQVIYFAQQGFCRTITIGVDGDYNTDLDNEHSFEVYATLGGINTNKSDRTAVIEVVNSLANGCKFKDGREMKVMPSSYYEIESNNLTIPKGQVIGCIKVHLTDAFFNDPDATTGNLVIPFVLTQASENILTGTPADGVTNPNRLVSEDWTIQPQDYIFYAVKYKNLYHGTWLSSGTDEVNNNGTITTTVRKQQYVEKDDVRYLTTRSLSTAVYTFEYIVPTVNASGATVDKTISCDLLLNFDDNGNCTISTDTPNCTASGSGKWTENGATKAWGNKDRDLIELNYNFTINYVANEATGEYGFYSLKSTDERLVARDRQNYFETFDIVVE